MVREHCGRCRHDRYVVEREHRDEACVKAADATGERDVPAEHSDQIAEHDDSQRRDWPERMEGDPQNRDVESGEQQ